MVEKKTARIIKTEEGEYRVEVEGQAGPDSPSADPSDDLSELIYSLQDSGFTVELVDIDLSTENLDDVMDCCPVCGSYNDFSENRLCKHFIGRYAEAEIEESLDFESFSETFDRLSEFWFDLSEEQQEATQADLKKQMVGSGFSKNAGAWLDPSSSDAAAAFLALFDVRMGSETESKDGWMTVGHVGLYSPDPEKLSEQVAEVAGIMEDLVSEYPEDEEENDPTDS